MYDNYLNKSDSEDHLEHFGVQGMHWGIRRYQNPDGTLTAEGKAKYKQFKKEVRADNRAAFEVGRDASVAARAKRISDKYLEKAQTKLNKAYEKNASSKKIQKLEDRVEAEIRTNKMLTEEANRTAKKGEQMCSDLIKKYGKELVIDIKRDKNGDFSERVVSGEEVAASIVATSASFAISGAIGAPLFFIYTPSGKEGRASSTYNMINSINRADVSEERKAGTTPQSNRLEKEHAVAKADASRAASFDDYVKEHGGKLTYANLPSHDRDGNPTHSWTDKQKDDYIEKYNKEHS